MALSSHLKRWITSLVLLPLLIWSLIVGGWAIAAWIVLGASLGMVEFMGMFRPGRGHLGWAVLGALIACAIVLIAKLYGLGWSLAALLGGFWIAGLAFLFLFGLRKDPESSQVATCNPAKAATPMLLAAGLMYLPGCLQFYVFFSPWEIGFVLLCVFMSDTGAYYTGSLIGGPKLWPSVSPKKTWAGSLGGLVLCCALALTYGLIFGHKIWANPVSGEGLAPWWLWLAFAAPLNIVSQLGDLFVSALKRNLGVKDSGKMLPGHGGLLDRMDSLIPSAPVFAGLKALYMSAIVTVV